MSWLWVYLYIGAVALLLSLFFVMLSMNLAHRLKLVDAPSARKIQCQPIPLLGGLGIAVAFVSTILIHVFVIRHISYFPFLEKWIPSEVIVMSGGVSTVYSQLLTILLGGLMVFVIGLIDDIYELGALPKLLVQILAGILVYSVGIRITLFSTNPCLSFVLTVFWVVAVTNAFNLLDNMDGLSSGIAMICAAFLMIFSIMEKEHFVALFLCALIGSVAGFFVFNYHPARVYMGDAGSYFIGYVLASATVMGTYYRPQSSTLFTILVPVLILGVPLYDLSSVIFIRLYRGQSIFKGDRQHFSHRIADCGISHRGVALFLYLVSFSFGISSLLLESVPENKIILIFLQTLGFASIIALMEYFGRRKSR